MEGIARLFVYIGWLLTILLLSSFMGSILSMIFGFDMFIGAWVVASILLALVFCIDMCNEVFRSAT